MISDPGPRSTSRNDASPTTAPPMGWRDRPAEQFDWSSVYDAMERTATDSRDFLLFELSQWVALIASDHSDGAEGCDGCDPLVYDRCPTWVGAQRIMLTWLIERR